MYFHCGTHPPVGSTPLPQIESASPTHNWEVLQTCGSRHPVPSILGKSSVDEEHQGKPCPATGSALLLWCVPASPAHTWEVLPCLRASWLPCLPSGNVPPPQSRPSNTSHSWKHSTAAPGPTLPDHGECISTIKKKNTSNMKKFRNHSQLKQQENSPKAVKNETDLCILTDLEFEREIVKIKNESREDINSNAVFPKKEL